MVICEGAERVEIEAVDRVPRELPAAGDTKLSVAVSSHGFSGQGSAWVGAAGLAAFVAQLRTLEQHRGGVAEVEGLSLGEFRLRVRAVDRRGHMAVEGRVARPVHRGEAGPYVHAVDFGFEFDASQLPEVVEGFRAIAEGRA